ncbi:GspH/FimT family pseudopilin [Rhodanobacter sp. C01]|uniref:GspH/FimT family pseudopilin n=1 Tax=Rhodanobacter sp. C01 TaxID=1945856 RepID=UPI002110983A|nr:GspH/FimT family pseudopilin [Rhodanobacter sp. C01]
MHGWGDVTGSRSVRATVKRHERGFTLVELMITLVVAVVLIMIAVPSFRNITLSNKLTTTANDIVNAIHSARLEAVKRNASTQLCSNSSSANAKASDALGSACGSEAGAVYVLTTPTPTQVLAGTSGITAPLQLNGDMTALRFTAQGLGQKVGTSTPYSNTVADICTSQMSTDNHRVITMTAGSILVTTTTSKDCPSS